MKFACVRFDRRYSLLAFAAALFLAACAQSSGTMPAQARLARVLTGPLPCKGQRTTKKYGSLARKLQAKGASFCIPAFGGFGGSLQYPGVKPPVKLTIRTSTANIYGEPQLGTGTSIVYVNLHFHAGTQFRSKLESKGGLTSEAIEVGDTYTAYGIVAVGHLVRMFPPCYTIATQGPYGGILPNLGELLSDVTVTGAGYGVIEIYSGAQVSQEC